MGGFEKDKPLPGTKWIAGDEVGRGGMGIILHVSKPPSILGTAKIITPKLARSAEFRQRFFEEARIQATLQHKHIVRVIDYDTLSNGVPFFVMERLRGKTLGQLLREGQKFESKLVHDIMVQVLEGLYRAHTNDPPIVHRDIKPDNIFLHDPEFEEPIIKILDFGIATLLDGSRDQGLFGTPGFAAPEQLSSNGKITPQTDLFAAGLLLFILLAGRGPFDQYRDEERIMRAFLNETAPSIRDFAPWVPTPVVDVIAAALSRNPDDRPRDGYHFMAQIFPLTWAGRDSEAHAAELNTTSPDARTMVSTMLKAGKPVRSTLRDMTSPPVEGEAPEAAPREIQAELDGYLASQRATRTQASLGAVRRNAKLSVRREGLFERIVSAARSFLSKRPAPTEPLPADGPSLPTGASAPVARAPVDDKRARPTERLGVAREAAFIDRAAPTRTDPTAGTLPNTLRSNADADDSSANEKSTEEAESDFFNTYPGSPGGTSRSIADIARRTRPRVAALIAAALLTGAVLMLLVPKLSGRAVDRAKVSAAPSATTTMGASTIAKVLEPTPPVATSAEMSAERAANEAAPSVAPPPSVIVPVVSTIPSASTEALPRTATIPTSPLSSKSSPKAANPATSGQSPRIRRGDLDDFPGTPR